MVPVKMISASLSDSVFHSVLNFTGSWICASTGRQSTAKNSQLSRSFFVIAKKRYVIVINVSVSGCSQLFIRVQNYEIQQIFGGFYLIF